MATRFRTAFFAFPDAPADLVTPIRIAADAYKLSGAKLEYTNLAANGGVWRQHS